MRKHLSRELILPSFWLLFFIVWKNEDQLYPLPADIALKKQVNTKKGANETEVRKEKNKESNFTKVVYLSEF